jgi:hypothetical protein
MCGVFLLQEMRVERKVEEEHPHKGKGEEVEDEEFLAKRRCMPLS